MKNEFIIGKYTLESLTNGMYSNPLDLYREYVQNAVDSIDLGAVQGVLTRDNCNVVISIDSETNCISIKDNGLGINKNLAFKYLLDIGNSRKDMLLSRGFRGIGRLSGLGYCDKLIFTTSFEGEQYKSVVSFNASLLKELLLPGNDSGLETLTDVFNAVVECKVLSEKSKEHYFQVELINVTDDKNLLDYCTVKNYLVQNMPLAYSKNFKFGEIITGKVLNKGYNIPSYNMILNYNGKEECLFKPYADTITCDRVKHVEEYIKDIKIKVFTNENEISAILWYADVNFNGTILDSTIKGIRARKGNILVGNYSLMSKYFKEERFNGWLIGELFVLDNAILPNARRDDFEQNTAYFKLGEQIQEWANEINKDIRKASYQRSSLAKRIVELDSDDSNALFEEDLSFCDEIAVLNADESYEVVHSDYLDKLSVLFSKEKQTKYSVLNINNKFTVEQRKTIEKILDILSLEYDSEFIEKIISLIVNKF